MASATLALSVALASPGLWAQSVPETVPDDYYRAEIVILQRLVDPAGIEEQMSGKIVDTAEEPGKTLWVEPETGERITELNLVPREELHLGQAANRLERSGNYRVLATAGWYEAFPPDYQGAPLQVATGNWLTEPGQRAVEGQITIDRKRYLHVNVHLNHWAAGTASKEASPLPEDPAEPESTPEAAVDQNRNNIPNGTINDTGANALPPAYEQSVAPPELITWIRETRRMRSEEIHFIDSPTIGVLVFFKKIEE
ncbi:CsiV family protein [Marinobacter sp. VGCF2001]|uniref:CsiV family protein n=1 Tax=Marinobacter sp. VGCF2001 TaxID=3417189 RepID=UPI003CE885B6